MKYQETVPGVFKERPNRFIAKVEINGREETVHVKNTGRCKELLVPGAKVILDIPENKNRKTKWDLIAVYKGQRLINMDANAPNVVVKEWLVAGGLGKGLKLIRPEYTYGKSRFDFYAEGANEKILIEVKGVTLEEDNRTLFPDAPSERAVKHVRELIEAHKAGYETYIIFVIQMEGVRYFTPNKKMHPEFAKALVEAAAAGVNIRAYDCQVTADTLAINQEVPVRLEAPKLYEIGKPVVTWYRENSRDLPWRRTKEPYRIWLSEIMLQQTRVEAVKEYYRRFLEALPHIHDLAQATDEELLKLWEGLGYYNRARNLRKAAQVIDSQYEGQFPADYDQIRELPGIGSYTAGAISAIAFDKAYPAVDGNVLRVVARLICLEGDIKKASTKTYVERLLKPVIPEKAASDFNQGLIELGATICGPNKEPQCQICPLATYCEAYQTGAVAVYPKVGKKKERRLEKRTVFLIRDSERVAITKREEKGLLAGMYEFPSVDGKLTRKDVLHYLEGQGLEVLKIKKLPEAKHIFSHVEWEMTGYEVKVAPVSRKNDYLFLTKKEIQDNYPLPSAFAFYRDKI
ncbi:A/G-specific adenine glycosylase [Lachnospiraceae bacterium PF1-22]|uniref:A/G-specific adenine glycosylase n=1 Tax=Ohessyouella blattaphilus TaxID=2949333 RepID=UPI003E2887BE